jgi:DNA-binding response OmpR family regulator
MEKMLLERQPVTDHMDVMWNQRQENSASCTVKNILIVAKDSALRNLLWEILQDETSCQIKLAPSGKVALNMLQTVTPQLFLLDNCLPDMNGLELVKRIRSMQIYEQTPILLMSELLTQGDIIDLNLRYLHKPFNLKSLIKPIEEYLVVE